MDFCVTPWHLAATIIGLPSTMSLNVSEFELPNVQADWVWYFVNLMVSFMVTMMRMHNLVLWRQPHETPTHLNSVAISYIRIEHLAPCLLNEAL